MYFVFCDAYEPFASGDSQIQFITFGHSSVLGISHPMRSQSR